MGARAWTLAAALGLGVSACAEGLPQIDPPGTGSGTAGPAGSPLCGNLQLDPDEECDDGNIVQTDGCTNDCRFGPVEIVLGTPYVTPTRGNMQPGVMTWIDPCPNNQVLIGLRGRVGNGSGTLRRLGGICGVMTVDYREQEDEFFVEIGRGDLLPIHGNNSDDNTEIYCSNNEAMVAFDGATANDNDGTSTLSRLTMHCAPFDIIDTGEAFTVQAGAITTSDPFGVGGGATFDLAGCGAGGVSMETRITADNGVRALALGCGSMSVRLGS